MPAYDIREDQPDGTVVFSLEPSSVALIEKLLSRRFPTISQVDCHLIAEFSGGNARVAIALASTLEKNETISGLSEAELFQRLFHQRHTPDDSLLLIAQACSIVYRLKQSKGRKRRTTGEHAIETAVDPETGEISPS